MSDSNTILPTAQLTGLEQGLDNELAALEGALNSQIYLENLPIIGTQLGAAFKQGQAALKKFSVLEANVKQALTNLNNLPNATLGNLQSAINGAMSSAGFANTVLTTLDSGSLTLKFNNSASATFNEALGSNFGLPGLNFDTSGSAQTTVGYNLDVTATVDASGNFSISTPGPAPALSLTLGVKAPTFTASASLGSSDATLGFLKFNAADKGSNLNGTFGIDTSGNAEFTGSANLDVALGSNMGSAALPSVSAELVGGWSFSDSIVDATNQASFGNAPSISLDNVSYDFGTFVNKFIEPILNEIAPVLQPIEQALAVFDTPLSFLGGGTIDGGNDGLLGTLWHQLDVAGAVNASGSDIPDGQITLVDLLKLATGANLAPMVNFLTTVTDIVQWATALSGSNVGSAMTYDLGSFSIPNDIRAANFDISQIAPVITGGQDLSTFLAGLFQPACAGRSAHRSPGIAGPAEPFRLESAVISDHLEPGVGVAIPARRHRGPVRCELHGHAHQLWIDRPCHRQSDIAGQSSAADQPVADPARQLRFDAAGSVAGHHRVKFRLRYVRADRVQERQLRGSLKDPQRPVRGGSDPERRHRARRADFRRGATWRRGVRAHRLDRWRRQHRGFDVAVVQPAWQELPERAGQQDQQPRRAEHLRCVRPRYRWIPGCREGTGQFALDL